MNYYHQRPWASTPPVSPFIKCPCLSLVFCGSLPRPLLALTPVTSVPPPSLVAPLLPQFLPPWPHRSPPPQDRTSAGPPSPVLTPGSLPGDLPAWSYPSAPGSAPPGGGCPPRPDPTAPPSPPTAHRPCRSKPRPSGQAPPPGQAPPRTRRRAPAGR